MKRRTNGIFVVIALFLAFIPPRAMSHSAAGESQLEGGSRTTQIVLLGTGTPNAEPDRSGPAEEICR